MSPVNFILLPFIFALMYFLLIRTSI
uniref:Uncharacterized protein n=1 Tax=Anguilla anguilla TaxID=7936 RepID=A0A0E9ULZ9_ANGAN